MVKYLQKSKVLIENDSEYFFAKVVKDNGKELLVEKDCKKDFFCNETETMVVSKTNVSDVVNKNRVIDSKWNYNNISLSCGVIKSEKEEYLLYADSYYNASEKLLKEVCKSSNQEHELMILPALYLFSHGVELTLKYCLKSIDRKFSEKGHNLLKLLSNIREKISSLEIGDEAFKHFKEITRALSENLGVLGEIYDFKNYVLKYPIVEVSQDDKFKLNRGVDLLNKKAVFELFVLIKDQIDRLQSFVEYITENK